MKKLLIVFVLLMGAAGGAGYYYYSQVTYQPSWYVDGSPRQSTLNTVSTEAYTKQIIKDLKKGKKVTIPVSRLASLAVAQIETHTGLKLKEAIKAVRLTAAPPDIEAELMVDVLKLPTDKLPPDARKALDGLIKKLPENTLKDLYVRSRLKPTVKKGVVSLDPSSGFSIGKMAIPLEKLEKALGKKAEIPLSRFPIRDFELSEEALVLIPGGKG